MSDNVKKADGVSAVASNELLGAVRDYFFWKDLPCDCCDLGVDSAPCTCLSNQESLGQAEDRLRVIAFSKIFHSSPNTPVDHRPACVPTDGSKEKQ